MSLIATSADSTTRELITVDGLRFRKAYTAAFLTALNMSPETIDVARSGSVDRITAYFSSACIEWCYPLPALREYVRKTLGETSAAYKSIPDLFTKD